MHSQQPPAGCHNASHWWEGHSSLITFWAHFLAELHVNINHELMNEQLEKRKLMEAWRLISWISVANAVNNLINVCEL